MRIFAVAQLAVWLASCQSPEAGHPGYLVYARTCAGCHDTGEEDAPSLETLRLLQPTIVLNSLDFGRMLPFGTLLSASERRSVAEYVTGTPLGEDQLYSDSAARCDPPKGVVDFSEGPRWNGWGVDLANTRRQSGAMASFDVRDLNRLTLQWAFGFPQTIFAWAQPTVAAGRVFVGSYSGTVYSLDLASGCTYWEFEAEAGVRTSVNLGRIFEDDGSATWAAYFGDQGGLVYAVDAQTGGEVWRATADEHPFAVITAAPALHENVLYVPVSSLEERVAVNPGYACCTFRGSLVALDASSGEMIWKTYTIPNEAKHSLWGLGRTLAPSGAAIWTTPTLDVRRRRVYVTTGDNYTKPATATSDAVLAVDMDSGALLWSKQMLEGDAWNRGCITNGRNCPDEPGPDYDFGAAPILIERAEGPQILLAAQKSGVVYAVDAEREGALLWQAELGKAGGGAILWGPAADESNVYVALASTNPESTGGIYALDIDTGAQRWFAASPSPETCAEDSPCFTVQSAALTLAPGMLLSGARDGRLLAYDPATGREIWRVNTAREYETVNGIPGRGGSINAAGPVVVGGRILVNSGYGAGGPGGNVLLVFGTTSVD